MKINKYKTYLSSNDYSKKKGLSVSQVNRLCSKGKLDAVKVKGRWRINPNSDPDYKVDVLKVPPDVSYVVINGFSYVYSIVVIMDSITSYVII